MAVPVEEVLAEFNAQMRSLENKLDEKIKRAIATSNTLQPKGSITISVEGLGNITDEQIALIRPKYEAAGWTGIRLVRASYSNNIYLDYDVSDRIANTTSAVPAPTQREARHITV